MVHFAGATTNRLKKIRELKEALKSVKKAEVTRPQVEELLACREDPIEKLFDEITRITGKLKFSELLKEFCHKRSGHWVDLKSAKIFLKSEIGKMYKEVLENDKKLKLDDDVDLVEVNLDAGIRQINSIIGSLTQLRGYRRIFRHHQKYKKYANELSRVHDIIEILDKKIHNLYKLDAIILEEAAQLTGFFKTKGNFEDHILTVINKSINDLREGRLWDRDSRSYMECEILQHLQSVKDHFREASEGRYESSSHQPKNTDSRGGSASDIESED